MPGRRAPGPLRAAEPPGPRPPARWARKTRRVYGSNIFLFLNSPLAWDSLRATWHENFLGQNGTKIVG